MYPFEQRVSAASEHTRSTGRPFVTLSYAQSLDGSISSQRGQSYRLSSPETLVITHRLRSLHDSILVGIGTILADDPQLNVRLVEGKNPQPVILDSQLRFPPTARLVQDSSRPPWIATTETAPSEQRQLLKQTGLRLLEYPANLEGKVPLDLLLVSLVESGIRSLMVEGGSRVITSFLRQRLVDQVVVTLTPIFLGGLPAVEDNLLVNPTDPPIQLSETGVQLIGTDLVIWGSLCPTTLFEP